MPVWKCRIGFNDPNLLGDQDYTFNGHVTASSTATAWNKADEVAVAFRDTVLPTTAFLTSIGVSNPDVVNGTLIIPQHSAGARAVSGAPLPGWNVARIAFANAVGTRQHTFFVRMGLTENDVVGQVLEAAVQTALNDLLNGLFATGAWCDKDGFIFGWADASPNVHMRQLGWRRRTRPGFKRGWVPV